MATPNSTYSAYTPPRPQAHLRLRSPKHQTPRRGRAQGEEVAKSVRSWVGVVVNVANMGAPNPCPGAIVVPYS